MAQAKKITGLSCGRLKGNSEILLKEALMAAEELGIESEIIRAMELRVKPCNGCEACTMPLPAGGTPKCTIKDDDAEWILEKILFEDAALIISVPTYFHSASGLFKAICDRSIATNAKHPEILQKTRVGGIIAVGGGDPGRTALTLSSLNIFMQQHHVLVDQMQVNYCGAPGSVLMEEKYLKRAKQLGQNIARSIMMPIEQVKYIGDEPEVACPVCHCNVLKIPNSLPDVYCPACWVHGTVHSEGGKMKVKWDEDHAQNYRFAEKTMREHFELVARVTKKFFTEDEPTVKERSKKYAAWGNIIKP